MSESVFVPARAAAARALVLEVLPVSRLSRALRTRASQEVSVLLSLLGLRCDEDGDDDDGEEVLLGPAGGLGLGLLAALSRGDPVRSRQDENLLR